MEKTLILDPFSVRLAQFRQLRGLSAAQLAERAGLSRTVIYRLEQLEEGQTPTLSTVRRLALALGVTVGELAG